MTPQVCDLCQTRRPFIRNLDTRLWLCLECAANAGEPTALQLRAQKEATRILDRILMPVQDIGEAA